MSIMVNGGPCGFFSMGRGLKQGDPLSPILFVLMEDVLSRNISQLVNQGKILPMVIKNCIHPTHLFFADDVFIFCNGSKKSLNSLFTLLDEYQASSGQLINKDKSKCFIDVVSSARKQQICEIVNMELSKFTDKYLGVILAPGRVTSAMVWTVVEIIQHRLAKWKGRLLSFAERWPASVMKIYAKLIRNFLWSGNSEIRKFKTLSWKKNKQGQWFENWKPSFVYSGLKWAWSTLKYDIKWIMKVKDLIKENQWEIPNELQSVFVMSNMPAINGGADNIIWNGSTNGVFTTTLAVEKMRFKQQQLVWPSFIWKNSLHPSIACNIWKLLQGVYVDDETMRNEGYEMPYRCYVPSSFADVCQAATLHSPLIKEVWITAACAIMKELWFLKNSILFENGMINIHSFKSRIIQVVHEGGIRMQGK
ncbi:uncharacterized protein LOC113311477 [Papaver somniferum]|uniref:uncharacterized protein LOC113311477 n=1 Tax=Papaver somniferum TaxID=3469 RepID=UPI000E6F7C2A|nr:uncharacterized protein LOC113311477 [Papaver somniferum]